MSALDVEPPNSDNGGGDGERESTTIKLTAIEAIFTSEKVQDIVPISKDSVLILGQGNMFLYGTSWILLIISYIRWEMWMFV